MDHLYSAGGIASAWHSNDAPEYNNAVVSRSGPTVLIVGGSTKDQLTLRLKTKPRRKIFRAAAATDFHFTFLQKLLRIVISFSRKKYSFVNKFIYYIYYIIFHFLPLFFYRCIISIFFSSLAVSRIFFQFRPKTQKHPLAINCIHNRVVGSAVVVKKQLRQII